MHPNPLFRSEDDALMDRLVSETAFGMVFLTTPDGPRVAHVPMLAYGKDDIRFHLARSNALTRHLEGARSQPRRRDDRRVLGHRALHEAEEREDQEP